VHEVEQNADRPATEPGPAPGQPGRPAVGVVIPTRDRPELVRRAVAAALEQDYPGRIEVVVVFDGTEPDHDLRHSDDRRSVRVIRNTRTEGLCGSRNTGVLALDTDLVAFCDDDDRWLPGKLTAQMAALDADPEAEAASTAMAVEYGDRTAVRLAGTDRVSYQDLLRSRMAMVHSSSLLFRRLALVEGIGLVDETIPGGMCEDWDILLRAARRHPVVHVDEPLVQVLWGASSYFAQRWTLKNEAHLWMLAHHPDIRTSSVGAARVYGQIAYGHAALGSRGDAVRWAGRTLRANWREPRALFALAVASGAVSDERVQRALNARGHGI
jgi:glycosyltransferase involved in cell wall biosynthesis